jgi:hypothetical protein
MPPVVEAIRPPDGISLIFAVIVVEEGSIIVVMAAPMIAVIAVIAMISAKAVDRYAVVSSKCHLIGIHSRGGSWKKGRGRNQASQ